MISKKTLAALILFILIVLVVVYAIEKKYKIYELNQTQIHEAITHYSPYIQIIYYIITIIYYFLVVANMRNE